MSVRLQSITLFMVVSLLTPSILSGTDATGSTGKRTDLRILYVGHPDSAREQDFVTFLKNHFKDVGTADLKTFNETQTAGVDVVILDYDGDGFKAPRVKLSRDYKRPTITVGVVGARNCSGLRLKSGYL